MKYLGWWIEGPWKIIKHWDTIPERSQITPSSFLNQKHWNGPRYTQGMAELDSKQGFWLTVHCSFSSSTWTEEVILNLVLKDDQNTEDRKEAKGITCQVNNMDKAQVGIIVHGIWKNSTFFLLLTPTVLSRCLRWVLWAGETRWVGGTDHVQEF